MNRAFLVIALVAVTIPRFSFAQEVHLNGEPVFDAPIHIGGTTGRIIKVDSQGLYVSVPKSANDAGTKAYVSAYKHGEWDQGNWLLIIPHSAVISPGEESYSTIIASSPQRSGFACYLDGKKAARKEVGTTGNFIGGFAGGLLLGYLGAGIAIISADSPNQPSRSEKDSADCRMGYLTGFAEEGQSKKRMAAAKGGIIGSTILLVVYMVLASN